MIININTLILLINLFINVIGNLNNSPTVEPTIAGYKFVKEYGQWGVGSCQTCSGYSAFPDTSAYWIWSSDVSNALCSDPGIKSIYFMKIFQSSVDVTGTLYVSVDDYANTYLNGIYITKFTWNPYCSWHSITVNIVKGQNTLLFEAVNTSQNGPAALMISLLVNNNYILHSDSSWQWTDNYVSPTMYPTHPTSQPSNQPSIQPSLKPSSQVLLYIYI